MYGDARRGQGRFHRDRYGDPKEYGFKDLIPFWTAHRWNPDELCALYKKMGAKYISIPSVRGGSVACGRCFRREGQDRERNSLAQCRMLQKHTG